MRRYDRDGRQTAPSPRPVRRSRSFLLTPMRWMKPGAGFLSCVGMAGENSCQNDPCIRGLSVPNTGGF